MTRPNDPLSNLPPDLLNPDSPVGARRIWPWVLALVVLGVAGYLAYQRYWVAAPAAGDAKAQNASPMSGKGGGPGRAGRGDQPIPVVTAPAQATGIDLYLNGLGTVTPLRTVTVRSRVEGQLLRVHFDEGQLIRAGQLLAEIDPRPFEVQLAQAEGQMARDRALLENARLDLERYQTLFKQDSIARQQVDTQLALVRQYEGTVKVNQSQIDNARLQLTYSRITAPVGGRAGLRQVDPGNIVRGSDPNGIVVITQLDPIAVIFSVPQDDLPALMKRVRSKESLPVEAWDREQKTRLATGVLMSVDNLVDPATGTVKLKAQFANPDSMLFANQFVNARMRLDTLADAIVIPAAALQRGAQGMFVYVVTPENRVSVRLVKLGPADGPRVAISEGLAAGESVVIDGMDRLREGALVEAGERPQFKPRPGGGKGGKRKGPEGAEGSPPGSSAPPTAEKGGASDGAPPAGGRSKSQ